MGDVNGDQEANNDDDGPNIVGDVLFASATPDLLSIECVDMDDLFTVGPKSVQNRSALYRDIESSWHYKENVSFFMVLGHFFEKTFLQSSGSRSVTTDLAIWSGRFH